MTDTVTDTPATATDGGTPVDDADALAGPPCANDPANPACARRMIAVAKLTDHPGNVREDLDLTPEFCASVAENGVRVPLLITTDGDGGLPGDRGSPTARGGYLARIVWIAFVIWVAASWTCVRDWPGWGRDVGDVTALCAGFA